MSSDMKITMFGRVELALAPAAKRVAKRKSSRWAGTFMDSVQVMKPWSTQEDGRVIASSHR